MKLAAFLVLSLCSAAAFGNAVLPADIEANYGEDIERLEASLKAYEEEVNLIVSDIEEQVDRSIVGTIKTIQKITKVINLGLAVTLNSKKCTLEYIDDTKDVVKEISANVDTCKQNALNEAVALVKDITGTLLEAYTDVTNLKSKYDKCNQITNQTRKKLCLSTLAVQAKKTLTKTQNNTRRLIDDTKQNAPAIVTNAEKCGVETKETAQKAVVYSENQYESCLIS